MVPLLFNFSLPHAIFSQFLPISPSPYRTAPFPNDTYTVITAYWPLDGNVKDLYAGYNGTMVNSPSVQGVGSTYFYSGNSMYFSSPSSQYLSISSPFLNISYRSFTVEVWMVLNSLTGDLP